MVEKKILSFSMTSFGSVTFFPSIRSSFGTFEVVAYHSDLLYGAIKRNCSIFLIWI